MKKLIVFLCLIFTACASNAQAAAAEPTVSIEPTPAGEYRVAIITDTMRGSMDAFDKPEAHECRSNPIAIYWHRTERQYAITCKMQNTDDQYGVVYLDEYGYVLRTVIVQAWSYNEVGRSLAWFGFGQ